MRMAWGLFAAGWMLISSASVCAAPLSYAGGDYTQSFDGLPLSDGILPPSTTITGQGPHDLNGQLGSTGLDGWTISNFGGSSGNTEFRAQDGSLAGSNGRGVVSFGTDNSTERALGVLATSNQISRFGLSLVNDTGAPFTKLQIAFTGEQWRRGNVPTPPATIPDLLAFSYTITGVPTDNINTGTFTDVAALSYTSPNTQAAPTEVALDGNAAGNQVALSHTIGGINWGPGEALILRWTGQDITGQDDGLAVDSLRVTAGVPEPATTVLAVLAACGVALVRRQRNMD